MRTWDVFDDRRSFDARYMCVTKCQENQIRPLTQLRLDFRAEASACSNIFSTCLALILIPALVLSDPCCLISP